MKKIVCDSCGSENAKSYKYEVFPTRAIYFKDFCVNCLQEFVLKNQVKLTEVQEDNRSTKKRIIHG
jgi:hypothetical protein